MANTENEGICKFNQNGFCKFGERCRNRHINEICDKESCKSCQLRHPKRCRYFFLNGSCKFGVNCAYRHENSPEKIKIDDLERKLNEAIEKIENLKEIVLELKSELEEKRNEMMAKKQKVQKMNRQMMTLSVNCAILPPHGKLDSIFTWAESTS